MRLSLWLTFFLLAFALPSPQSLAAETTGTAPTSGEAELQAKIRELEQQLDSARQNISQLEAELAQARKAAASPAAEAPAASIASTSPGARNTAPQTLIQAVDASSASRTESVMPALVTSLGPMELANGGVEDISRLEFLVPGLRYGQSGRDSRFSMRGARTNSIGPQGTPVVAVYENGVYSPTTSEALDSLLDVERINVLRGPQLTTFGQQAYAGAISVVNNKPAIGQYYGAAELESGLPDKTRGQVVLNLPAGDHLAIRLAGLSESRSGWIDNGVVDTDADDLNENNTKTLRASMLWQVTDDLQLYLWSRTQDQNGTGSGPWGYQQTGAYVDGALVPGNQFAQGFFIPDLGPWIVFRNFIPDADYEHWVNAAELNWNLGFASLQWINSFTSLDSRESYDNDYSNSGDVFTSAFAGWSTSQETASSELRFASANDGPLNWAAGLFWLQREANWGWLESFNGVLQQPDWDTRGTYVDETKAAFAQASYAFTERLRVTAGLRWNDQGKELKTGEEDSWSDVSWQAALEYELADSILGYLSVADTYLAGGLNSAPGVNPTWDPEALTAYEAGIQTVLANGTVSLNLAAWYNDFQDVQSQAFLVQPYPGSPEATEYTGNGGDADAKGVDASLQWTPTEQWYLATHIAYTDAKFSNYSAPNLAGLGDIPGHTDGDRLIYDGWRPALTPEWVIGLQASYVWLLKKWGSLTPYLQTTWASGYYGSDINLEGTRQDAHGRTDLRLIWNAPQGNLEVQFYMLNLTNEAVLYWTQVYNPASRPDIATVQASWANPDTYGFIFKYAF